MICHSCLHSHVMLRNISTIIIKVKASGKMYVVTTKTIYKKRVSLRRVMYNCINAFFFSVAVAMGSGSCHILHRPPCLQSIPVPICNGREDQRYILQYSSCHLSLWFDGHSLLQDVHCSGKVPLCVSVCVLARV